jgi:hypothetical protein
MQIIVTTTNKQQEKYLIELLDSKGIRYTSDTKLKSDSEPLKPSIAVFLSNAKASLKNVKKRKKYFDVDFARYEYLMKKYK